MLGNAIPSLPQPRNLVSSDVQSLMDAHVADFAQFKMNVEEYIQRYFIGHYNPLGNFFHAFALKDALVEMLDPKPDAYRARAIG